MKDDKFTKSNKKNEAMLEAYMESAPNMIWFQDRDFRYVKINKAFKKRIKKGNSGKIIGKRVEEFWPTKLAKKYAKENEKIAKSGKTIKKEEILHRKNGKKIYLETIKGPVVNKKKENIGFFGSSFDVTPYKKIEKSLKKSKNKFKCLVENLDEIVYSLDKKNKIKYISPVARKILGYKPEDIEGRSFLNLIHKEDVKKVRVFFNNIIEKKSGKIEHRMVKKNGKVVWVSNFNRLKCENNGFFEASGLITDLTEQKQTEKKLIESYKYLGDINRRISVFLSFDKMLKSRASREGVVDIILKSLLEISDADSIFLCKFNDEKKTLRITNKILKNGYNKRTSCNNGFTKASKKHLKFLENLEKNNLIIKKDHKEMEISRMKINEKINCYFSIPIFYKRKLYSFLLICFKQDKIMQEHERKLYLVLGSFISFAFSELKYHKNRQE